MKSWIRTNAIGFPLIVLMAALILVTITWPSRDDSLGFRDPVRTVPIGDSTEIDGTRWSVEPIEPDLSGYRSMTDLDEHPENSVVQTYLARMTGNPAAEEDPTICSPVATDGSRRWGVATLAGTRSWAFDQGFATFCRLDKSFVMAFEVPVGTDITAVDLLLLPRAEGDAAVAESRGQVIRFLVE